MSTCERDPLIDNCLCSKFASRHYITAGERYKITGDEKFKDLPSYQQTYFCCGEVNTKTGNFKNINLCDSVKFKPSRKQEKIQEYWFNARKAWPNLPISISVGVACLNQGKTMYQIATGVEAYGYKDVFCLGPEKQIISDEIPEYDVLPYICSTLGCTTESVIKNSQLGVHPRFFSLTNPENRIISTKSCEKTCEIDNENDDNDDNHDIYDKLWFRLLMAGFALSIIILVFTGVILAIKS